MQQRKQKWLQISATAYKAPKKKLEAEAGDRSNCHKLAI